MTLYQYAVITRQEPIKIVQDVTSVLALNLNAAIDLAFARLPEGFTEAEVEVVVRPF